MQGLQIGFLGGNWVSGNVKGLQLGFIFNVAQDVTGGQISFINVTKDIKGLQLGFVNVAKDVTGNQLSFINVSQDITGSQLSFINVAKKVKGLQLGFVNVAYESSTAVVGLVNVIKNGYRSISLNTGEALTTSLEFKSGGKYVYSILSMGSNFIKKDKMWTYGLGIGSFFTEKRYAGIEAVVNHVNIGPKPFNAKGNKGLNILCQLRAFYNKEFSRFILQAGPTLNFSFSNRESSTPSLDALTIYKKEFEEKEVDFKLWPGIVISIGAIL